MDAKERLRQYLEQRRDAGESELVLDSMSVEEVMRMLGAASSGRPVSAPEGGRAAGGAAGERAPDLRDRAMPHPSAAEARVRDGGVNDASRAAPPSDWREALRALDPRGESRPPQGAQGVQGAQGSQGAPPRPGTAHEPVPRSDAERAPAPTPPERARVTPSAAPSAAPAAPASAESASESAAESTAEAAVEAAVEAARDTSHATMPLEQVPAGLVVGSPAHELFGGGPSPFATLDELADATRTCQLCALHRTAKQAVPGHGNPHADFVCVGEAPGANEDEQGLPFVGQAGQLLTKILAAISLSREDVFICNVLKHRPPGNRNPLPDEVAACSPYLVRQIELLQPKVIVALGTFAAQTLLQSKEPIGKLRGKIHRYYGVPLIVTYHPAALLRNPSWKRPTWEDVQLARRLLDRARGA